MTEIFPGAEMPSCPFHQEGSDSAERRYIMHKLGGIVNPLLVELAERVEGGAVDMPSLDDFFVRERSYEDVRETVMASHPYTFSNEEERPIVVLATGRFQRCLEVGVDAVTAVHDTSPIRIPVGYDSSYSHRLIRATAGVVKAVQVLRPQIYTIANQETHAQLLLNHTYQGVMRRDPVDALQTILCQGVVLSGRAEAILTAEPVEGFVGAPNLAKAVREADLPADFTLRAGPGMLSTIIRHGRYVSPPVVRSENGALELSEGLRQYEKKTQHDLARQIEEVARLGRTKHSKETSEEIRQLVHLKQMYGMVCPAASKGVPAAVRAIAHVANRL